MTASPPPLVTVVVPSYNYARFIRECVQSIWAQTWRPLELIVVDDGSQDDSVAVVSELLSTAPIPMRLLTPGRVGLIRALNLALENCSGEYVSLLAADDRMSPTKTARQVELLRANPRMSLAHCEFASIDAEGRALPTRAVGRPASGECFEDLLRGRVGVRTGATFRKSVLERMSGFDSRYLQEDWPAYLRAASLGPVGYVAEELVDRRIHGANFSTRVRYSDRPDDVFRHACVDLLEELAPGPEILADALVAHLSVPIRVALHEGQMSWAARLLAVVVARYPSLSARFLREFSLGLGSFGWARTARKVLPRSLEVQLGNGLRRALRSR